MVNHYEFFMRRHQMETFSALLALCAGNSSVTGEFPAQRPVTRSFDIFFDLRLNKRFYKQSWGWRFETPSRSVWRHCNVLYFFTCHQSTTVESCETCKRKLPSNLHYDGKTVSETDSYPLIVLDSFWLAIYIYMYTVEPLWKGQENLTKVAKIGPFPCTILYKSCLFYPS